MNGDNNMVTIYTAPNCLSSKKAKAWLEEHNILYVERRIENLTIEEVKLIVGKTEEGLSEIISTRSNMYKKLEFDIESASIQKLFRIICENPTFLRSPIIMDKKRLLSGYNETEIRRFLPRRIRKFLLEQAQLSFN